MGTFIKRPNKVLEALKANADAPWHADVLATTPISSRSSATRDSISS